MRKCGINCQVPNITYEKWIKRKVRCRFYIVYSVLHTSVAVLTGTTGAVVLVVLTAAVVVGTVGTTGTAGTVVTTAGTVVTGTGTAAPAAPPQTTAGGRVATFSEPQALG